MESYVVTVESKLKRTPENEGGNKGLFGEEGYRRSP